MEYNIPIRNDVLSSYIFIKVYLWVYIIIYEWMSLYKLISNAYIKEWQNTGFCIFKIKKKIYKF